jgi:hypothetical protein
MPQPPRRGRFHVHLSTAIVFMFAAGLAFWLTLHPREGFVEETYTMGVWPARGYWLHDHYIETSPPIIEARTRKVPGYTLGWPLKFADAERPGNRFPTELWKYDIAAVIVDTFIVFAMLFAVVVAWNTWRA